MLLIKELRDFYKDKVCLVTGGAGFIGSHVAEALLNLSSKVFILNDLIIGSETNIHHLIDSPQCRFIKGDVRSYDLAHRLIQKVDLVFHMAARVIGMSFKDPKADMEVNIGGTFNMLAASFENPKLTRLVYASSASVYGNSNHYPLQEDDPPNPISFYAVSKLSGEYYCKVFHDYHGLPTTSLRYFNVCGPRQSEKSQYGGVIAIFARRLASNNAPTIYGNGESIEI